MGLVDWWYYTGTVTKAVAIAGIAAMAVLALALIAPHVQPLRPIAQSLGLIEIINHTVIQYQIINHTVYVNHTITVTKYINQTVPVYVNRTVYMTVVNGTMPLSTYLNDLFGWGGLRCWIVTYVYTNASSSGFPACYDTTCTYTYIDGMATVGVMIVPPNLTGRFDEVMYHNINGTFKIPNGVQEVRTLPDEAWFFNATYEENFTSVWNLYGYVNYIHNSTNEWLVFVFGDTAGTGPGQHWYIEQFNNTASYLIGIDGTGNEIILRYNQTYTVLFLPEKGVGVPSLMVPLACNWTIIGPVSPGTVMLEPIPYAQTVVQNFAEAFNMTPSQASPTSSFGFWVWDMNVTATETPPIPYPTW